MPAPLLILAVLAVSQAAGAPSPSRPSAPSGHGRAFISPMGEPFHAAGFDGLAAWFQQADSNHDGSLFVDEVRKDAERFFLMLDRNHDGEIGPEEIERYENVVAPEIRIDSGWGAPAADDESSGGGRLGVLSIPEPVASADSNLDRGISAQEFQTAAEKRFGLLDLNHDGRLTLDELQAARSAVRSNARRPRHDDDSPKVAPTPPPEGGQEPTGRY
jgi:EF hand